MRSRQRSVLLVGLTLAALLTLGVTFAAGAAEYQGSDPISNVSPDSGVKANDALINRHPIGHYALDVDVEIGLSNLGDVIGGAGQSVAAGLWDLTVTILNAVISLFAWAFGQDLLAGDGGATSAPTRLVIGVMNAIYNDVFGREWLVVAVLGAGMWAMWRGLVQQRYAETVGALGLSMLYIVVALFFVARPEMIISYASQASNGMSRAFLSLANSGDTLDTEGDKREITDRLFESLIYDPWVVLNFGGMSHCVAGEQDEPRPVNCRDPHTVEINHKYNRGGRGGYAEAFLYYAPRTEDRAALFSSLATGEVPDDIEPIPGRPPPPKIKFGPEDKPGADIALAALGWQRAAMAALILVGSLGAAALLGFLSLAVILAQVIALMLLVFAPIALVAGALPGAGHRLFREWIGKLATVLFVKAIYSLALAVVLAVAGALLAATSASGPQDRPLEWLLGYLFLAAFYWAIFLYRKQISATLLRVTARQEDPGQGMGRALTQPVGAMRDGATGAVQRVRGGNRPSRPAAAGAGAPAAGASAPVAFGGGVLAGRAGRRLDRQARDDAAASDGRRERRRELAALTMKPGKSEADKDRLAYLRGPGSGGADAREAARRNRRRDLRDRAGLNPHTRAERRDARRQTGDLARTRANGNGPGGASQNGNGRAEAAGALGAAAGANAARGAGGASASKPRSTPPSPREMLAREDRERARGRSSAAAAAPLPPPRTASGVSRPARSLGSSTARPARGLAGGSTATPRDVAHTPTQPKRAVAHARSKQARKATSSRTSKARPKAPPRDGPKPGDSTPEPKR